MKKRRNGLIVLTLLWVCVIFSFSLQPGELSSDVSSGFGAWLLRVFLPRLARRMETMSPDELAFAHHILRKCAHFTEYLILGVFSLSALFQIQLRRRPMLGFGFCAVVACVDETIQLFVSGRAGQIPDVLLDCAGALCGLLLLLAGGKLYRQLKH